MGSKNTQVSKAFFANIFFGLVGQGFVKSDLDLIFFEFVKKDKFFGLLQRVDYY